MLDEAEGTSCGLAVDHEADAECEQVHDLPFVRAERVAAEYSLHLFSFRCTERKMK
jgi:hypothetical protein